MDLTAQEKYDSLTKVMNRAEDSRYPAIEVANGCKHINAYRGERVNRKFAPSCLA